MIKRKISRVIIVGGGTAGWMAAVALSRQLREALDVTLIESDQIGSVGVGEATIPPMRLFHKLLRIDEKEFMCATEATFKLGIQFEGWGGEKQHYAHAFGKIGKGTWMADFIHFWLRGRELGVAGDYGDYSVESLALKNHKFGFGSGLEINYAYHLDAQRYAGYLRRIATSEGVNRVEGRVVQVKQHPDTGFVESVSMENGQVLEGDLFIDCSGFAGLLIDKTLHIEYEGWSHWLPCDRAVAIQTASVSSPVPYTQSIAHRAGWRWCIPLQHRVGNGLVYSSRHMSDEEAVSELQDSLSAERLTEPRVIKFNTGRRSVNWSKNVIALGLASGFLEPLESTSIHLIMTGINRLLHLFPFDGIEQAAVDEYNGQCKRELESIRDFIILHYKVTDREDSSFWRYCRDMDIPEGLQQRIELFRRTAQFFPVNSELFGLEAWTQVLLGQGVLPQGFHNFARIMNDRDLGALLRQLNQSAQNAVSTMPSHYNFLKAYCSS